MKNNNSANNNSANIGREVWLDHASRKLVRRVRSDRNRPDKILFSVSVPCDKSTSGFISFLTEEESLRDTFMPNGAVSRKFVNVLLGRPEGVKNVSIRTNGGYEKIRMTNAEIYEAFEAERRCYNAAKRAELLISERR